ncbi:MAG: hypothetical protein QNK37_01045 [Acidobacteriota bacterium]|nr:hypothetical protein [Acidobacteriota bacterium]
MTYIALGILFLVLLVILSLFKKMVKMALKAGFGALFCGVAGYLIAGLMGLAVGAALGLLFAFA